VTSSDVAAVRVATLLGHQTAVPTQDGDEAACVQRRAYRADPWDRFLGKWQEWARAASRSLYRRSRADLGQLGEPKHRTWVALPVVFVRGVPTPAVLVWFVSELHPSQQFCRARREFVDERPERLISAVTGLLVLAHNGSPGDSGVPGVDCSTSCRSGRRHLRPPTSA